MPKIANSVIKMSFFAHGGISIKKYDVGKGVPDKVHVIDETGNQKFHLFSILTG